MEVAAADQIETTSAGAFVERWQGVTASDFSTAQSFVRELCELLDVPAPHPTPGQDHRFERRVIFSHGVGNSNAGRVDGYRRFCWGSMSAT